MKGKTHVVVLMGGVSAEHEVSLNSGAMVTKHLDPARYHVTPVTITQAGEWLFPDHPDDPIDVYEAVAKLKTLHAHCVFIALHGPFGEDGRIQGMLDMLGIPYTGSGCSASAIAIDKTRAKALAAYWQIPVAKQIEWIASKWDADHEEALRHAVAEIGFPCVVKSPRLGSSLGMAIAKTREELAAGVELVLRYGERVMVERFVSGTEVTCAVLDVVDNERPIALPLTEIRPVTSSFFDYHAKYTAGATQEITPAQIPDAMRDRAQEIAVRAHEIMGCRGFSRSDMIIQGEDIVWLEINTIPGLTQTSLFPQAAAAAGISLSELLGKLVEAAIG